MGCIVPGLNIRGRPRLDRERYTGQPFYVVLKGHLD